MKIRAITFKQDGNTIKEAQFEVTEPVTGVFLSEEKDGMVEIFFQHNGIYASVGEVGEATASNMETLETIKDKAADPEAYVMSLGWVNKVFLEWAKQSGMNYEAVLARCNDQIAAREEAENKRKATREEEKKQLAISYRAEMDSVKAALKNGEWATYYSVSCAMTFFNFEIHPRTKGAINKLKGKVKIGSGEFKKGTAQGTINNVLKAVEEFANS